MPLFCQRKRSEFSPLLCCGGGARHVARLYTGPFVLASEQARHQLLCVFEDLCIRIVDALKIGIPLCWASAEGPVRMSIHNI